MRSVAADPSRSPLGLRKRMADAPKSSHSMDEQSVFHLANDKSEPPVLARDKSVQGRAPPRPPPLLAARVAAAVEKTLAR